MKHEPQKKPTKKPALNPQQNAQNRGSTESAPALSKQQKGRFWMAALTAAVIGIGGYFLLPPTAPDADHITNAKRAEIQQQFNQLGALNIQRISDPAEISSAIASMDITDEQKQQLTDQISNDSLDMAWIQAWDNAAEDGDVLQFDTVGYRVTATLLNKPVIFALPLAKNNATVTVTGVHDGGGGITASVITSSGAVSTPVINTGASYVLSLR